jgi:hypothetical protein
MKMNMGHYQRGESQTLAIFLLVIVAAIIAYLFWADEMGTSAHTIGEVLHVSE